MEMHWRLGNTQEKINKLEQCQASIDHFGLIGAGSNEKQKF
jgi:hypothetical protein